MATTFNRSVFGPLSLRRLPARSDAGRTAVSRPSAAVPTAVRRYTEELSSAEYAVISTPTGQHLVEEGKWFALSSEGALKASSGGGQLRFQAVAVKRADGEFMKGKPFLADWVVEAELIDEQAFALQAGSNSTGPSNLLGKVLVTRITHTEETRRRIGEALRA
ncbi:hypothetical protein Vretimale_4069 [Volvox reticuliferus]|uniref:Uncharacterized protein n=1 Tax=Volvox reticuliferus TaxID=1737510 RepID=A0A8J4DB12_9CHLO|nr:hypothetical protein Vretimale_4069 [Volvox reticuliferus]